MGDRDWNVEVWRPNALSCSRRKHGGKSAVWGIRGGGPFPKMAAEWADLLANSVNSVLICSLLP